MRKFERFWKEIENQIIFQKKKKKNLKLKKKFNFVLKKIAEFSEKSGKFGSFWREMENLKKLIFI